jgi:hypothetical protein
MFLILARNTKKRFRISYSSFLYSFYWQDKVNVLQPLQRNTTSLIHSNFSDKKNQGCGSGLIFYGSGSSIFAQSGSGSGSGSKLKQNFRRQFLSQIFLKSKFESNQIKNTCVPVIHQKKFFKKYLVLFYTFIVVKFF